MRTTKAAIRDRRSELPWVWIAVVSGGAAALVEFVVDPWWSGSDSRHAMPGFPFEHLFLAIALFALGRLVLGMLRRNSRVD